MLGTPPAFVLSQDQTLKLNIWVFAFFKKTITCVLFRYLLNCLSRLITQSMLLKHYINEFLIIIWWYKSSCMIFRTLFNFQCPFSSPIGFASSAYCHAFKCFCISRRRRQLLYLTTVYFSCQAFFQLFSRCFSCLHFQTVTETNIITIMDGCQTQSFTFLCFYALFKQPYCNLYSITQNT